MKNKGFTLVELLAVIIIIALTAILIVVKVDKNIKDAKKLEEQQQIELIENAAYIYATTYKNELPYLDSILVDEVSLDTLITKGLLNETSISEISTENKVIVVNINNNIKVKYNTNQSYINTIFLIGLEEITIKTGSNYEDDGAYIAIPERGIEVMTSSNITSTLNINQEGKYKITYTYEGAQTKERIIVVKDI